MSDPLAKGIGLSDDFVPPVWLRGPHLQTIVPYVLPAPRIHGPVEPLTVVVEPETAVRVDVNPARDDPSGTVLLVHGLGGSSESSVVRRMAFPLLENGWTVARMNCRTCGGTESLSRTLYNAGQSADVGCVLEAMEKAGLPRPFVALGFSLGGNLVLGHAGKAGRDCGADAALGINPAIDLEACARGFEEPRNRFYQWCFTRDLCRIVRAVRRVRHVPGPPADWRKIGSVREFDRLFTAPDAGYSSAEVYYEKCSAGPMLPGIAVPTLVLASEDDPFVPVESIRRHHSRAPDCVRFLHPSRGGHVGYFQRGRPRSWSAQVVLAFLSERFPLA